MASWPLGVAVQFAVLLLVGTTAIASIIYGIKTHRPTNRVPWILFALAIGTFICAAMVSAAEIGASLRPLRAFDIISMFGYLFVISAGALLGRLRDHDKDPTNRVDAIVQTCAVGVLLWGLFIIPFLARQIHSGNQITTATFAMFDLGIMLVGARIANGPGARAIALYLMSSGVLATIATDTIIDASFANVHFWGIENLPIFLTTYGMLVLGTAALHPGMAEITVESSRKIGEVSRTRLVFTSLALVVPPIAVVTKYATTQDHVYLFSLGPICILISLLVMSRFAGIARARERQADLERSSAEAAAHLASAQNTERLVELVPLAVAGLLNDARNGARVMLFDHRDNQWHPPSIWESDRTQKWSGPISDAVQASLQALVDYPVTTNSKSVTTVPTFLRHELTGAIVVESLKPLTQPTVHAIELLGSQATLAYEASRLSEDLVRRKSDRRFRALIENSSDLIVVLGKEQLITFSSPAAERLLKGRRGDTRSVLTAVHPDDQLALLTFIENASPGSQGTHIECRLINPEGEPRWYEISVTDMRDDEEIAGVVINAHDITGRKELEDNLRHRVLHDDLTGIPNRTLFHDRLQQALRTRKTTADRVAVLLFEIDDFKVVNDSLGHNAGDELLKILALRFTNFLRSEDTAARFGGDEFAVLLTTVDSPEQAAEIARRLIEVVNEPIDFQGIDVSVSASAGIASTNVEIDAEVLIRNADVAMYNAKQSGKAHAQVFDEAMLQEAMERLDIKRDLSNAIANNELQLYFQPVVNMHNSAPLGFEALLRWIHPVRGFIPPDRFIPIAEENGLIQEIGLWVIEHSISALAKMTEEGHQHLTMNLNVSASQLSNDDVQLQLERSLREHDIAAERIIVELTESSVLKDDDRQRLENIRAMGIGIAADDFGSGFASYASLQQLPFTAVKIDRSLIIGITSANAIGAVQVRSIIDMAHASGLTVVAEGIEEECQREILASMSCDKGQGYLFSRPIPLPAALEWLAKQQEEAATA